MDNIKEKLVSQLGFNAPSAAELVSRDDYDSEQEYLSALVSTAAKLDSPEVKRALRQAGRERVEIDEEAERERQRREYKDIRASVRLDSVDEQNIAREATSRARADLAAGKISPFELGERIEAYTESLTKSTKDQKAANQQINSMFRRELGY